MNKGSSSSSFDLVARQNSQTGVQILRRVRKGGCVYCRVNLGNKGGCSIVG